MNRRKFFAAVPTALTGALSLPLGLLAEAPAARPLSLRTIYRKVVNDWHQVRMFELRPGDLFVAQDHATLFRASRLPCQAPDGMWGVRAEHLEEDFWPEGVTAAAAPA